MTSNGLQTPNGLQTTSNTTLTLDNITPHSQLIEEIQNYDKYLNYDERQNYNERINKCYEGVQNRRLFEWMQENPCKVVPLHLRFDNWKTQKDPFYSQTPLMIYLQDLCEQKDIEIINILHQNPNYDFIPSDFKYDNWQIDKDEYGETPLMLWLRRFPFVIPKCLKYNNWQEDVNDRGETPLMQHLGSFKGVNIPKEYKYSDWQISTNYNGETPEIIFERRFPNDLPPLDFDEASIFDIETEDISDLSDSYTTSLSTTINNIDQEVLQNIVNDNSIDNNSIDNNSDSSTIDYSFEQFELSFEQESSCDKK